MHPSSLATHQHPTPASRGSSSHTSSASTTGCSKCEESPCEAPGCSGNQVAFQHKCQPLPKLALTGFGDTYCSLGSGSQGQALLWDFLQICISSLSGNPQKQEIPKSRRQREPLNVLLLPSSHNFVKDTDEPSRKANGAAGPAATMASSDSVMSPGQCSFLPALFSLSRPSAGLNQQPHGLFTNHLCILIPGTTLSFLIW